jgi:aminoglycoside phosphotransferase (APT) family kinase protein
MSAWPTTGGPAVARGGGFAASHVAAPRWRVSATRAGTKPTRARCSPGQASRESKLRRVHVIAAGRASEIVDLGNGRVLRRFKGGGEPEREARIMEHAAANGFPVPRVLEVERDALILERVDGPTMLADLYRRPWRAPRHAVTLADLHTRLHAVRFEGEPLLHLDLHPENILLSERGPIVIDWTNARAGDPALDVALTWVIGATSGRLGGRAFTRLFLRQIDRAAARAALPEAVAFRLADPNVTETERSRARRLLRP